jgi:hypothetical protein
MLTTDELRTVLRDAVKEAGKCTRFCTYGAVVEGGSFGLFHNGTGPRDTDTPRVHNSAVTNLGTDPLKEKLRAWITDLHSGNRIDLNGG